jgi:hypothetical protein
MTVTVTPETFTMVEFSSSTIAAVTRKLLPVVGLSPKTDVLVEVDERVPLGRCELVSSDPIVLQIEGGALEDPKRPRQLSKDRVADNVGRLLFQARDRLDDDFGPVPPADSLTLALANAWDVYCTGRLVAQGYPSQRQRWLYAFRNRHGFTDAADEAFERLWSGSTPMTWADIASLSAATEAVRDTASV